MIPDGWDSKKNMGCRGFVWLQQMLRSPQKYGRRISQMSVVYIFDFGKLLCKELLKGNVKEKKKKDMYI